MRNNLTRHSFAPGEPIFANAEHDNVLIAVDGIDGSGKTTVVNILTKLLAKKGVKAKSLRITQGGTIARSVSKLCIEAKERKNKITEAIYIAALQSSSIEEAVFPELEKGNSVVIDRWLASYYAYQYVGNNSALAGTIWKEHLNKQYGNTPDMKTVDLYIYCYTDVEMSNYRIQNDPNRTYQMFDYVDNLYKDVVIRGYDMYYDAFVGNKLCLDTRYLSVSAVERILTDLIDSSGIWVNTPTNDKVSFPELDEMSFNTDTSTVMGRVNGTEDSCDNMSIIRALVESRDMEIMQERMCKLTQCLCETESPETPVSIESVQKTILEAAEKINIPIQMATDTQQRDKKVAEGMAILEKGMRGLYQKNTPDSSPESKQRSTKLVPIVGDELIDLVVNKKVIENPIVGFANLTAKTYDKKLLTEIDVRISPFIRRELYRQTDNDDRHHFATEVNWENMFTDEYFGVEHNSVKGRNYIKLEAGEMILGKTMEKFQLPGNIMAEFSLRSWAARSGINQSTSLLMKPNWSGQLVLELHNALRHHVVYLEKGAVIGQVRFFRLEK